MQQRPGTFIAIEGTDGSGKGTQFEILCERLRLAGYQVATFDFPQYESDSSYFVRQYLNGKYGKADEVGPYTASLFYALDRYEAAAQIKEALRAGKVVISNRFTGSSMAHQGTKFRSPEERRGYFIWLDNLEFEMLQIPRPDISFVLRVPADIAQSLVDKKAPRSYTKHKRDIHEADIKHLEKSVEVYDDLTQLFPKDFQRIDCVRSGALLDRETIQAMLWEKITPLLPPPPQLEMPMPATPVASTTPDVDPEPTEEVAHEEVKVESVSEQNETASVQTSSKSHVQNGSFLLGQRLFDDSSAAEAVTYERKDDKGQYRYYLPPELNIATVDTYRLHMDTLFDLYAAILSGLTAYLMRTSDTPEANRDTTWKETIEQQAREVAANVLPLAATADLPVRLHDTSLEKRIVELCTSELSEARKAGEKLLEELQAEAPELLDAAVFAEHIKTTVTYRATTYTKMRRLAVEQLSENYAAETEPVQLSDVVDLIPEMLYEYSGLPITRLREQVNTWGYNQKIDVFETYIGQRTNPYEQPGNALRSMRYTWDLVSSYAIYREIQRHCAHHSATTQILTPRYGYEVPQLIESAELVEQFEECFDISLKLYSLLQKEGYDREAQYATLLGHKLRWQLRINASELFGLFEISTKPSSHPLLRAMHQKLSEVHPMLVDCMRFTAETPITSAKASEQEQHA